MIPDEAVEAAMDVVLDDGLVLKRSLVHDLLEAAAPHLMAAAWDQGYEKGLVGAVQIDSAPDANPYRKAPDA